MMNVKQNPNNKNNDNTSLYINYLEINKSKEELYNNYENRIINQIEKTKPVNLNKKDLKKDIKSYYFSKLNQAIELFNARHYEKAFNKMESSLISSFKEFANYLIIYDEFDRNILIYFLCKSKHPNNDLRILSFILDNIIRSCYNIISSISILFKVIPTPQENNKMLTILEEFSKIYVNINKNSEQSLLPNKDNSENNNLIANSNKETDNNIKLLNDLKFENSNSIFILCCSIVSLNSLYHILSNKEKMPLREFVLINRNLNSEYLKKVYDIVITNKLIKNETDYSNLICKANAIIEETSDIEILKFLKKGDTFRRIESSDKESLVIKLSKDEKMFLVSKPSSATSLCQGIKKIKVKDIEKIYLGKDISNNQRNILYNDIDKNLVFTIILKNNNTSCSFKSTKEDVCRLWYKGIKYLILKSNYQLRLKDRDINNKTVELNNISEDIVLGIWKTEILPNWDNYRNLVINNNNSYIDNFNASYNNNNNNIKKNLLGSIDKSVFNISLFKNKSNKNCNFVQIWSLGVPKLLRKKVWSLTINNNKSLVDIYNQNNNHYNEVNFDGLIIKYDKLLKEGFSNSIVDDSDRNIEELLFTEYMTYIKSKEVVESNSNIINNKNDNLQYNKWYIIFDILNIERKYRKIIQSNNSIKTASKFKCKLTPDNDMDISIFKNNIILCNNLYQAIARIISIRTDINYTNSILQVLSIIYLNSDNLFECINLFFNFIYNEKFNFILKYWNKEFNFINIRTNFFVYWFKALCPEVYIYFDKLEISIKLYMYNWIDNLFSETFDYDLILRIWDIILLKGEVVLYELGLAIIKVQEKELINLIVHDISDRLKKPSRDVCLLALDVIVKEEIDLNNHFKTFINDENLAYEKGLLLQTYMIDD